MQTVSHFVTPASIRHTSEPQRQEPLTQNSPRPSHAPQPNHSIPTKYNPPRPHKLPHTPTMCRKSIRDSSFWLSNLLRPTRRGRCVSMNTLTTAGGRLTPPIQEQQSELAIETATNIHTPRIHPNRDRSGITTYTAASRQWSKRAQYDRRNYAQTHQGRETKTIRDGVTWSQFESCKILSDVADVSGDILHSKGPCLC